MTEELYVKIGGVWRELELQRPSGITFEFKSTLFSDITKVTSSKTYTFTLPGTAKNNLTLQNLSDLRHTSKVLGAKMPCIYKINGINFIDNPSLYISQVAKDKSYKAIMSWGGIIMEEDCNINELKKGDVVTFEEDWMTPNYGSWGKFNSNADDILYPAYSCGVPAGHLYVTNIYTIEGNEGEYYARTSAPPLPVISVYNILTEIEKRYTLTFDFKKLYTKSQWDNGEDNGGCEIVNKGVIPIKSLEMDKADLEPYTVNFSNPNVILKPKIVNGGFGSVMMYHAFLAFRNKSGLEEYIKVVNETCIDTFAVSGTYNTKILLSHSVGIKLSGEIVVTIKPNTNREVFKTLRIRRPDNLSEIKTIEAKRNSDRVFTYSFKGEDAISLDYAEAGELEFSFGEDSYYTLDRENFYVESVQGSMTAEPMLEIIDMDTPRIIRPWSLLPEISCKDFVKSLFYIAGGFPVVKKDGSIGLSFFNDIKKNMESGNIYKWTDYLLEKKDHTIKYSDSTLGISNYYLMKNENLEKTSDNEEESVYNNRFARLMCDNMSLSAQKTICKMPYNTQYLKDSVNPEIETGKTFRFYRWKDNKLVTVEAKPSIGILTKKTYSWLEGLLVTYELGMETWQFPQDLEHDERYAYFAKIIKNPQYVECKMTLPIFVLVDIDFSKPIYLEQFNSLFVATDIRYTSKTGISTVSLIKIPTN